MQEIKQKYFDKMVKAIIDQAAPSINPETGFCRYRGEDGKKCAVGHLIPQQWYNPHMEDRNSKSVLNNNGYQILLIVVPELHGKSEYEKNHISEFIRDVQRCHDNSAMEDFETFVPSFIGRAQSLATQHNLEWNF